MSTIPQPLDIFRCSTSLPIPVKNLHRTARLLYLNEHIPLSRSISVVFCSDTAIRRLNARYRKINCATDVLSFNFKDDDLLGEIYISLPRAAIQARKYGTTYRQEVLRLFIHGFYHLAGYDHKTEQRYKKMEMKERKIIKRYSDK